MQSGNDACIRMVMLNDIWVAETMPPAVTCAFRPVQLHCLMVVVWTLQLVCSFVLVNHLTTQC